MRLLRRSLLVVLLTSMCMEQTCFANQQVVIPMFTAPVQNYAVIDLSGSTTAGPVESMALGDSNDATFAFLTPDPKTGVDGCSSYLWHNGTAALVQHFDTTGFGTFYDGDGSNHINIGGVTLTGDVIGGYRGWFGNYLNGEFKASGGVVTIPITMDPPLYQGGDYSAEDLFIYKVASGSIGQFAYLSPFFSSGFVSSRGHNTLFLSGSHEGEDFSYLNYDVYYSPYSSVFDGFFPSSINSSGYVVGNGSSDMGNFGAFWDGVDLTPIDGTVVGLNDQNQVIADQVSAELTSWLEGGLWRTEARRFS